VVSTHDRTGDDELGHYMNRLGESSLSIGNRLDGVNRAREISVTPELRGDDLVLRVEFEEGHPPRGRTGELVLRFEPKVNRFLALALEDREKPALGSGRLLSKVRAVAVPRFDTDWESHLKTVREIVSVVEQHESRAAELKSQIDRNEVGIDLQVYRLYGLSSLDVAVIDATYLGSQGPASSRGLGQRDSGSDPVANPET
jgi:hypothetical protein